MAHTCATDCLHVIFSFLPSLVDVASCALACRRWSTAAAAATGVGQHQIRITSMRTLRGIAESPLCRLIGGIDISSLTLATADRIESLWAAFPRLTALTCRVDEPHLVFGTALQFPRTLRILDVTITMITLTLPARVLGWSRQTLNILLSLAVRCPLTRLRVAIEADVRSPPAVRTIERLRALSDTLTDLELRVSDFDWEPGHIAVFRSLPHLTRLHVADGRRDGWSPHELNLLTAGPTPLTQLRSVDLEYTPLSTAEIASLTRLSSLTQLHLSQARNDGLALLAQLPHLTTFHLHDAEGTIDPLQLGPALATCASITDLTLTRIGTRVHVASDEWLLRCLTGMSQLRSLRLFSTPAPIAQLATIPHLADTLEHLETDQPQSVSALASLRSLHRLESARLPSVAVTRRDLLQVTLAQEDEETVFLPSLESLSLGLAAHTGSVLHDASRILGRLPALRTLEVRVAWGVTGATLLSLFAQMPEVTRLTLETSLFTAPINSADFARIMLSMPHLRELKLSGHGSDLAFLSSSSRLAHTLERLTITSSNQQVTPRYLLHLQSLTSLRYLDLNACVDPERSVRSQPRGRIARLMRAILGRFAACATATRIGSGDEDIAPDSAAGRPADLSSAPNPDSSPIVVDVDGRPSAGPSAEPDPPPPVVDCLRELRKIRLKLTSRQQSPSPPLFDLACIFGRMPQLRSAAIECRSAVQVHSIGDALAHCTRLTDLTLKHDELTCAHLVSIFRPLALRRSLRSLVVESTSPGGLAFASDLTNLEHLTVRATGCMRPSLEHQLDHLRGLTFLRTLDLRFLLNSADSERATPYFCRRMWPHVHTVSIDSEHIIRPTQDGTHTPTAW